MDKITYIGSLVNPTRNVLDPMDSEALLKTLRKTELSDLSSNPIFNLQTLGTGLAGKALDKYSDYLLSRTEDDLNTNNVQDRIYGNSWGDIFTQGSRRSEINSNINDAIINYDNVDNNANLASLWDNNDYQLGVNKLKPWEQVGAVGTSLAGGAAEWASTAAKIDPMLALPAAIAGGIVNGTKSLFNVIQGNKTADIANATINRANNLQLNNFYDQARSNRRAMYRNFADGGPLESENGVEFFNVGGTHESNPYGGIYQGTAEDGSSNLVEEGEVLYNDYVFSKRLKANGGLLKRHILPDNYAGMTFADIAKKVQEDSEQRPYDPISKNYLEDVMTKLQAAQEEVRAKKASKEAAAFDKFNNIFAKGGSIKDNVPDWDKLSYKERIQLAKQIRDSRRSNFEDTNPLIDAANRIVNSYDFQAYKNFAQILNQRRVFDQDNLNLYARKDNTMPSDLKDAGFYYKDAQNYMKAHNLPFTVENYKRAYNQMRLSGSPEEFRKSGVNAPLRNSYGAKPIIKSNSNKQPVNSSYNSTVDIESNGNTTYKVTSNGKTYRVKANSPDEARQVVRSYMSSSPTGSSESTRTSVKVSEKVRVPGTRKGSTTTTTKSKTVTATEPLVEPSKTTPTTPQSSSLPDQYIPDLEQEPEYTTTTSAPTPRYRRSPYATAAMLAPAIGNIGQAFTDALGITNRPDYYVERGIRRNASQLNPIAPKLNTDYQEYRPYDVNIMNNQLLAQEYAAQRGARENFNKHTQAAQLLALNNTFGNIGFMANLQAQQANDARRTSALQWNHGINKENEATVTAYDEINQGIKQQRLNMLNQALQAKDASDTARAQVISANRSAALTDLGNLGRYINDTGFTQALINSGVFGPLNTDMSDAYRNLQILNLPI